MYIQQYQLKNVRELMTPGKVVVLYGPRRVGKTTLVKKYMDEVRENVLFVNGDDIIVQEYLGSQSIQRLKEFVGGHSLMIVDEAQYVKNIGLNLKLIVDHNPEIQILATGSSSFDLAKDVGEPLTGRKTVIRMFPLAQMEISSREKIHETRANLESRLIYGSYPEVVITADNRRREEYLREIVSSYLFKDIFELEGIRHSDKLVRLLQLLAFQVGKEASLTELGKQLGMSKNTVERYLDLLEKVFVVFRLNGFSRNLRKEVTKSSRYFFYDNGIRNAVIGNFNPVTLRNDAGQLWENYIIGERRKKMEYLREGPQHWFWRTYDQKEIDLVEEKHGNLFGYEIKWSKSRGKVPGDWEKGYPEASYEMITRKNYLDFIQ